MLLKSLGDGLRALYSALSSSSRSSGACEGPRGPRPFISSNTKSSSTGASFDTRLSSGKEEIRKGVGEGCRERLRGCCRIGDSREEGVRIGSPPGSLLSEVVMHANVAWDVL
jgi:hypothetical protein